MHKISTPNIVLYEYALRFLNFQIIDLCNSFANCWSGMISLLIPDLLARVTAPHGVLATEDFL